MEANESVFCAALDLSKAFDSICHHRLQSKLVSIGFDNFSCAFNTRLLTDRLQRVKLSGISSNWISVKQGVPQGTILGPVLFLIYVNEMRDLRITSKIVQYADDTLVFTSNVYPQMAKQELEHSLENLAHFFEYNHLQVNPKKTELITFSKPSLAKRTELMTLDLCNEKIEPSHSIKYLGVHLDKHLKYDIQVKHTLKKMATSIKTLAQIRGSLTKETRLLLYRSLVISQLEYLILLLTSRSKEAISSIDRQVNWGIKTAFFRKKFDRPSDLIRKDDILCFGNFLAYSCTNYLVKLIKNQLPSFTDLSFPTLDLKLNCCTLKFSKVITFKSLYIKKSYGSFAASLWNELDRTTNQKLLNSKRSRCSLKQLLLKTQTTNCSRSVNDHWRSCKL